MNDSSAATDGVTLVLVPGLLCDRRAWAPVIDRLAFDGAVRVADLGTQDSIAAMAEDTLAANAGLLWVAGHSMGARVAMEMARIAPARIGKLALLDTGHEPCRPAEVGRRQARVALAYRDGMRALAGDWLPPMVHPARLADAELMDGLYAMVESMTPEMHERQIRALLTRPDAGATLPAIACPTLVMVGREDGWSPLAQHEEIARRVAGSRLVVIDDAGHFAPLERPAAVAAALNDWLAN